MAMPLSLQVADEIERFIKKHQLPRGTKLGAERTLAAQYHVSRTVLREALFLLGEKGLLELRKGEGAFVADPDSRFFEVLRTILVSQQGSFLESLEVRETLELSIISKAARFIDDDQLHSLEQMVEQMESLKNSSNPETFIRKDMLFHETIARCVPNSLFHLLLQMFYSIGEYSSFLVTQSSRDFFSDAQAEHQEILRALKAHQSEQAVEAMAAHIQNIRNTLIALKE